MDSPAKYIDHTLLKADCTEAEIADLCEQAVEYDFATVCLPPVNVPTAKKMLYGSEVSVCTVVGFPMGYQTTAVKVFEAGCAVDSGAAEVDMVINLGAVRARDFAYVENDVHRVVEVCGEAAVKVIIECCLFDDEVKRKLAEVVVAAGADFVKTSTGFSLSGATVEDVQLLSEVVADRIGVKAAGGIRDWSSCQKMLSAGATRIGTSAGVTIMQQWQKRAGLRCR
jgi:deoxyribose-phosphate aldolase